MPVIEPEEISKLQGYLTAKLKNNGFALKMREKATDSVEVLLNGEFVAIIYKIEDEGETSYDLNMSILDVDLDGTANF